MSLKASEFNFIVNLLKKECAIVLEPGKEYLVELRLGALADAEGFASFNALIQRLMLNNDESLANKVIDAMTTNETLFFRDLKPYDFLKQELLPHIFSRKNQNKELNIWSAACSTGQEPYSIAMLLHHNFPLFLQQWQTNFLATDISSNCIQYAKNGHYNQFEVNRGLPVSYLIDYFQQNNKHWEIKPEIKSLFNFRELNLIKDWPLLPKMDIIFLRNVLIYFDIPTKKEILAKVRQQLKPNGYLFLGSAETPLHIDPSFERIQTNMNVNCYQLL